MSETERTEFDAGRELCSDGNCLGVVVDGRCNVCRLPGEGSGAGYAAATSPAELPGYDAVDDAQPDGAAAGDQTGFDDERQLCADGACTGILGPDGRCKVCGRSAAS